MVSQGNETRSTPSPRSPCRASSTAVAARLTRDDWITAALAAIADAGRAAVGVEPLAVRLGATKGSFYWHFENRDALLEAAISRWEQETTTDVVAEITAARDAPASQFRRLVAGVIDRPEPDPVSPALL